MPLGLYLTFMFSDVLRGYRKATPGCNGLTKSCEIIKKWAKENLKLTKQKILVEGYI